MRTLTQNLRNGRMRLEEVPAPLRAEGQVLVRTTRSLISAGTEKMILSLAKKSLLGKALSRPDLVRTFLAKARSEGFAAALQKANAKLDAAVPVGYSAAGVVIESDREDLPPGQRVACGGARFANHAELISVPHRLCVFLPDEVSDEDAAFSTVGAIAMQGVRQADPQLGEVVVVIGLGLVGLLTVQILKANGCRVLGLDPDRSKQSLATDLGADACAMQHAREQLNALSGGRGADAVIITASTHSSEPIKTAGELCRLKGRISVVGMIGMEIPRNLFYEKELDVRLSMSYGPGRYDPAYEQKGRDYPISHVRWTEQRNMESFLQLVASRQVTPQSLVTHRFAFDEALAAYQLLDSGDSYIGIMLEYAGMPDPASSIATGDGPASTAQGLALIGAGGFARGVLYPQIAKLNLPVRAVAAATGISAAEVARQMGARTASTDYSSLLDDDGIGAVVITTRHHLHAAQAIAALNAGKHVFLEKPLALTRGEVDAVREVALSSGQQLMVGFNRRFSAHATRARRHLQEAGPLSMIYRVNAGKIPVDFWVQDPDEGGGRMVGEACHFIDLMTFICGSRPRRVMARGVVHDREDIPLRDNLAATIEFENGSIGTLHYVAAGSARLPKERFEAHGSGLSAAITDYRVTDLAGGGKSRRFRSRGQDKGFAQELKAFVASMSTARAAIPLADIEAVSLATFAIEDSLRCQEAVDLS